MKKKCFRGIAAVLMAVMIFPTGVFAKEGQITYSNKKEKVDVNLKTALEDHVLNYDEALAKGLDNNTSIQTLEDNVELMEDSKQKLMQTVDYIAVPDDTTIIATLPTVSLSALNSINSLDTNLQNSKYNKEIIEISTEYMVKNYFIQIKKAEDQLELAKQSLSVAEESYEQSRVKNELGMLSDVDLATAKDKLEQSKKAVESLELSIQSLYVGLNNLLGFDTAERYTIEYTADTEPVSVEAGIESYVTRKLSTDPYIKIQEANAESAKFGVNAYAYDGASESYMSKEVKMKTAERTLKDTSDSMREKIRSTYNSLQQLEANRISLETALSTAQRNYDTAKKNFEIGNTTQLAVDQAALAVKQAETNILTNDFNYDTAKFTFENPSMLVMSGSSAS
ncbi:MAG: TolC family protein [Clostridiales bacterium]|nr:TolC family protein [Clostridiales bacterium]